MTANNLSVIELQLKDGNSLDSYFGKIGSQIDIQANKYLPGTDTITQYRLLYPKNLDKNYRNSLFEIKSIEELKK